MLSPAAGSWLSRTIGRAAHAPLAVWLVVLMSTATAAYQYPTYGIKRTVPQFDAAGAPAGVTTVRERLPLAPYVLGTGLLILGTAVGARWAFVLTAATVWIFPLETWLGIKQPLHGSILSVLHLLALALLVLSWPYFSRRSV